VFVELNEWMLPARSVSIASGQWKALCDATMLVCSAVGCESKVKGVSKGKGEASKQRAVNARFQK